MFYSSYISKNKKRKNTLSIHKKNRLELIVENSAKNILGCFVCLLACLSVYLLEIVYKNKKKNQNNSKT